MTYLDIDDKEINEAVGKLIKSRRKRKKLSQTDLAEMINASKSKISKIENGKRQITIAELVKLAYILSGEEVEENFWTFFHREIDFFHDYNALLNINNLDLDEIKETQPYLYKLYIALIEYMKNADLKTNSQSKVNKTIFSDH